MSSIPTLRSLKFVVGVILLALMAGCGLTPEFTYQGKLTDAGGNPLNGSYTITYKLFDALTAGNEIYSETNTVPVTDGLFESVIGPNTAITSLDPKDLTKPLFIELTISDGTVTETLQPRQHLYGAPYAFTLMPGSYISGELGSTIYGASNVKSVLTVQNEKVTSGSDVALPALRVFGETGIELSANSPSGTGRITSNSSSANSDLEISSNDEVYVRLDQDNNSISQFTIYNGAGQIIFQVQENGTYYHSGGSTGSPATPASVGESDVQSSDEGLTSAPAAAASVANDSAALLEDFGTGTLVDGVAEVALSEAFVNGLGSNAYLVFVTPLGDCNGLFVAEKSGNVFVVRELAGGSSNVSFDFRVVAQATDKE